MKQVSTMARQRWIFVVMFMLLLFGGLVFMYSRSARSFEFVNPLFSRSTTDSEEHFVRKRLHKAEIEWVKEKAKIIDAISDYTVINANAWNHSHFRSFWDWFYPSFDCPHLRQRLGRLGDGGKWVCGFNRLQKKKDPCIVYSYGVAGETSFEEEILRTSNCSVYMYDHTVDAGSIQLLKTYPERVKFYKLGIGTRNTNQLRTLKTEMTKHSHDFIDILKVDVEGAEYDALVQIKSDFPKGFPFGQLLIELHVNLPPVRLLDRISKWWKMLEDAGLRPFQNEVNSYCPLRCFEYSFLNTAVDNFILHAYD